MTETIESFSDPQRYPDVFAQQVSEREIFIQTRESILSCPNPEVGDRVLSILNEVLPDVARSKDNKHAPAQMNPTSSNRPAS